METNDGPCMDKPNRDDQRIISSNQGIINKLSYDHLSKMSEFKVLYNSAEEARGIVIMRGPARFCREKQRCNVIY